MSERRVAFLALERQLGLSKPETAAICRVTADAVAKWRSGARGVPQSALTLLEHEAALRQTLTEASRP